jgi:hypothetical protein
MAISPFALFQNLFGRLVALSLFRDDLITFGHTSGKNLGWTSDFSI